MNTSTSVAPYALIVDDNFLIRMEAMEILEQAGFQVFDVEHSDAALELLEARHAEISLLFTDVQMPGKLDGFALARSVAAAWPHISIVVASGHVKPEPGMMPDKARFTGKPFSASMVHAHLQEILPDAKKPEPLRGFPVT